MFTSGGTITALLQLIVGVPPLEAFELNWQIVNTSLTRLKFRGEEVSWLPSTVTCTWNC